MKQYKDYELADFLTDEDFRDWIRKGNLNDSFRAGMLADCPEKGPLFDDAVAIAKQLTVFPLTGNTTTRTRSWEAIEARTAIREQPRIRKTYRYWPAAAALLLFAGTVFLYTQYGKADLTTYYAEMQSLRLPDKSEVTLGANSHLSYNKKWDNKHPREVWLKGEATFNIRHLHKEGTPLQEQQRFLVHTDNNITIEVLGTVFMVKHRHGKTTIALESGAVKVYMAGLKESLLQPGEILEIIPGKKVQRSTSGAQQLAGSFRQQYLSMQHMPLKEILEALQDNYGIIIIAQDTTLSDRQVDGILPLNNRQQALMALTAILDVQINNHNDTLWLIPAGNN